MADFTIKTNDTAPVLEQTLTDYAGNAVDLTGADLFFKLRHFQGAAVALAGTPSITQVGDGSDGTLGYVQYEWGDGDLEEAGAYEGEWEVHFIEGAIETFPNDSYVQILILADIEDAS